MYAVEYTCTSNATTHTITDTTATSPSTRVPTCNVRPPIGAHVTADSCTRPGDPSAAASTSSDTTNAPAVPATAGTAGPPGMRVPKNSPTIAASAGNAGSSHAACV